MQPEFIFETSWEVCNKVGGIYAVLSTKAATMQEKHKDKVFFFGPDLGNISDQYFHEQKSLLKTWKNNTEKLTGLQLRIGRWLIPGQPIAILINFSSLWQKKNQIYSQIWQQFHVSSLEAYGDYDESSLFGYAVGMTIQQLYLHLTASSPLFTPPAVAHFNEWQTAFGLFYIKQNLPQVATLFTTHATGIGRSIAGNLKPLYDYFYHYNGDQMAQELNMVSKHSAEKQAAHAAHCFTTVSQITAKECQQLLDKSVDIVTPNGFENQFVPQDNDTFNKKRTHAKKILRKVAEKVLNYNLPPDTIFCCTSGRYEFKNKGIDALIHSLAKTNQLKPQKPIVCFIMVPAWQNGPHTKLGVVDHITTHQLCQPYNDPILNTMQQLSLYNLQQDPVKIIFVPSYLKGDDGIFNLNYYDLLIGMDLTIFPSYYEPWGYTPLESVAFHIPTITTNLAGFGQWAQIQEQNLTHKSTTVIQRTDSNWQQMTEQIAHTIAQFTTLKTKEIEKIRKAAAKLAEKALWKHFFQFYEKAYTIALKNL